MTRGLLLISLLAVMVTSTQILSSVAPNQRYEGMQFNLGFPDFAGSCIDEDMRQKIIDIINSAT